MRTYLSRLSGELVGAPGVPASSPCNVIPKGSDSRGKYVADLDSDHQVRIDNPTLVFRVFQSLARALGRLKNMEP